MMLDARQENAKTLAMLLGIDETEASSRLEVTIPVTHDPGDQASGVLAGQIRALLERTVSTDTKSGGERCVAEVVIGDRAPVHSDNAVWLGAGRDGASIEDQHRPGLRIEPLHPALSLLVACHTSAIAVDKAFGGRAAARQGAPIELDWRALFGPDLSFLSEPTDVGEAFLAGAGAIGNAVLLALREFPLSGRIHVCDPKGVTPGGLNRCLWFGPDDLGHMKATRICERAQPFFPHVQLEPHTKTVHDALKARGSDAVIERLIVAAESRRVRRSLQNELPREVFDASTTDVREVVMHFNRQPSDFACLSCIYPETEKERAHEFHVAEVLGVDVGDVRQGFVSEAVTQKIRARYPHVPMERLVGRAFDTLFKELCGEGMLRTAEDRQVLAPFAFVSVLAGTHLAIELVRRTHTGQIEQAFNYWRVSPWHTPMLALRQMRPRLAACEFCGNATLQRVSRALWADRRD